MGVQLLAQTKDQYDAALALGPSQQISTIQFAVSAPNSCKYQVAKLDKSGAPQWDENDLIAQPGQGGYADIFGIRFKSFSTGNPTVVLAAAFFRDDPTPLGIIPSSSIFGVSGSVNPGGGGVTTGVILAFGGAVAPTGFFLCNGTAIDRTTYAALFAVIGTLYGVGDGSTTFNVPDLQGRVPVGLGSNADVSALGNSDGLVNANRSVKHHHTVTLNRQALVAGSSEALREDVNLNGTSTYTSSGGTPLDAPAYQVVNYIIAT